MPMFTMVRCDHERCRMMIEISQAQRDGWFVSGRFMPNGNLNHKGSLFYCPIHAPEHVVRKNRQAAA